jgi:hypothetical protein
MALGTGFSTFCAFKLLRIFDIARTLLWEQNSLAGIFLLSSLGLLWAQQDNLIARAQTQN